MPRTIKDDAIRSEEFSIADDSVRPSRRRGYLKFERLIGLYLLVILSVVFSIWMPNTFGTSTNFKVLAASQAIAGIMTLGLVVSLICGVFDLSVAANMSLAISLVGWLQTSLGLNAAYAVVLTLLAGAGVGVINSILITKLLINPVIATLGMSAILAAAAYWVAKGDTLYQGISHTFVKFGTTQFLGLAMPVYYFAALALLLWFLLEHTPWGRYLYAAGGNAEASRLAGVNVQRIQWSALIVSGMLSSLAGIVLTMQLGAASFNAGAPYLFPAFAAAFLGSTLVFPGRFNIPGTVLALYLLAVAVKGLQLYYPASPWIANFVQGLTLLATVGVASRRFQIGPAH